MAVVIAAVGEVDKTMRHFVAKAALTLSGNYGAADGHGDVLDLGGLCPSHSIPSRVEVFEEPAAGAAPTGYAYCYAPGTTIHNGKLVVMAPGADAGPIAELTGGDAYPAALTAEGVALKIRAWFPAFL